MRESENKYRNFFDDSPLPMWVLEKGTRRFLDVNETAIREYGYSREEFLSMTAYDIRNDDEKRRLKKLVRTGEEGTRSAGIWQHLRKNGTEMLCEISVHKIHYNHSDALLVMCNNVTEREKIRRQVIESEQRLRNTLDTMLEGVQIIDFNYRYHYVNEAMARHGKYPREAFAGKTVMEMFPGIEQTDVYRVYQQCFAERVPIHLENFFRYPDGSTGWFELLFQPIPEGLFILSIDITERKKSAEKLLNSEKIYRAIASSIPGSVICIIDKDRKYRLIEGDMLEKFGYQKSALLNKTVAECLPPQRYAEIAPLLEKAFNGHTFSVEDSRTPFYSISKFVPLPDMSGNIEAIMIAVFDITEVKLAQQRIEELNQGLEQKVQDRTQELARANKEMESFSYSVSHDLRTPLRGIDGWSLALMEDYGAQLDEGARTYLTRIRMETQRMGELIDDLLRLSRLSRSTPVFSRVDFSALAHQVAAGMREAFPGREIHFSIDENMIINGDAQLLQIMLTNLLGNACKFTGKQPVGEIALGRKRINRKDTFFVTDNGAGFDMRHAKNLFAPFQRLHRQSEFQGTGIGLAIVQRIVHIHKGVIWADAAPDNGATFYFTLN